VPSHERPLLWFFIRRQQRRQFRREPGHVPGVQDGWPVEFINTETGTNDWHSEKAENAGPNYASTQPQAQAFDRIMRAHLAVVDRTMQHAAIFDDFGLFKAPVKWTEPETLSAFPGFKGQDTRLKTFRRLALAYATHGAPLPYTVCNNSELAGKLVYFGRWTRPRSQLCQAVADLRQDSAELCQL